MKSVSGDLNNYLNQEKHFNTTDIYKISLKDGSIYHIADCDHDIYYNGQTYEHNRGIFKRTQTKLSGEPTVDTVNITISCDENDTINGQNIMKACHDGCFDQASVTISKLYYDNAENIIGKLDLFEGRPEVTQAGGLRIYLAIKSVIQGLAALVPIRIFAPQTAYTNTNGNVVSCSTDKHTALIPLKPSNRVLIKL